MTRTNRINREVPLSDGWGNADRGGILGRKNTKKYPTHVLIYRKFEYNYKIILTQLPYRWAIKT